ncbi:transmembrane protein 33-like [Branchiostoma floridae]|uniref:Transmembrane protein 33-like n=2 Tax=Branchiostoma floridae TaxID=7739 RepID=A0A9J7LEW1_BRAFL|nr:transmembrane protein 33-like [Branchiostoma floridae]
MADSTTGSGSTGAGDAGTDSSQPQQGVVSYMMSHKVDAGLWLSRVFTVGCSLLYAIPLLGMHVAYGCYQRALISSAITSVLRLHQRLPRPQLTREFFAQLVLEDSAHYLFFALIFVNSFPFTMILMPVFLFALLHATAFTKTLLNIQGPNAGQFLRSLLDKLVARQQDILRLIACTEIFLMPAVVFMVFGGRMSLLVPFIYYRFLTMRYASRRNPYSRQLFYELRVMMEQMCSRPSCPVFIRNMCTKAIGIISRLAPPVAQ